MAVVVTADMYSGRPNPTWELSEEEARQLVDLLSEQKQFTPLRSPASLGILGYRGFVLSTIGEINLPKQALIFDGIMDLGSTEQANYVDENSELEIFLLQTAGHNLTQEEKNYIDGTIRKNSVGGPANTMQQFQMMMVPPFDPGKWNNDPRVTRSNNCYNYSNDKITNSFAQPGRGSGQMGPFPPTCQETGFAAERDGQIRVASTAASPAEGHYIALVIWPGNDYHWYRLDSNGQWSHKPGQTPARNTDNTGNLILNPEVCDRGPYTQFCGYFHSIPSRTKIL